MSVTFCGVGASVVGDMTVAVEGCELAESSSCAVAMRAERASGAAVIGGGEPPGRRGMESWKTRAREG